MPTQRGRQSLLGLAPRRGTSTLETAYLLDSHYSRSDKERWLRWHNRSYRSRAVAEEHVPFDANVMYQLPNGRLFALKLGIRVPFEWKVIATRYLIKTGVWSLWDYSAAPTAAREKEG